MNKSNQYIEIARTTNLPFSSMGIKSCLMIQEVLSQYYAHVGISTIDTLSDLETLVAKKPDLVFLGLKRLPFTKDSEAIWMSEYLDTAGINYTGSTKIAIELDFNKESAKVRIAQAGLPTADFFTATPGQYIQGHNLPLQYPLFVKPLDTGGGKGVGSDSVVTNFLEFQQKVAAIYAEFGSSSMVEKYLTGREFSVAILGNGSAEELIVMPIELLTDENELGHRILGTQVKSADTERVIAIENDVVRTTVGNLAKSIYQALGARDLGRIDIRMDGAGKPYFLEANLVPGLADNDFVSYFNRACIINQAMDYTKMILAITELGLTRNPSRV